MSTEIGIWEGDVCNRNGCQGVIRLNPRENCSCHISPPCHWCVGRGASCPECDWSSDDDEPPAVRVQIPDVYHNFGGGLGLTIRGENRELDPSKIDYYTVGHSGCTQLARGVYPPGTSMEDVRKVVNGTFGGRFNSFDNGKFEFVQYTD